MSDAERIKFWTQHAIGSEADREYLAASAQAQISIALSLQRIAEALEFDDDEVSLAAVDASVKEYYAERLAEEVTPTEAPVSPVGNVRAAALEIEANIVYLEDMAAQRSIVDDISAIIAKHLFPVVPATPLTPELEKAGMIVSPTGEIGSTTASESVVAAQSTDSDGVCNRCGWEREHMAHHYQYGSHTFEPGPYKDLKEWRRGNNVSQVLPNVE